MKVLQDRLIENKVFCVNYLTKGMYFKIQTILIDKRPYRKATVYIANTNIFKKKITIHMKDLFYNYQKRWVCHSLLPQMDKWKEENKGRNIWEEVTHLQYRYTWWLRYKENNIPFARRKKRGLKLEKLNKLQKTKTKTIILVRLMLL